MLNLKGEVLGRFGEKGKDAGQLLLPHWLCVDRTGGVYVAEVSGQRVQKFVSR